MRGLAAGRIDDSHGEPASVLIFQRARKFLEEGLPFFVGRDGSDRDADDRLVVGDLDRTLVCGDRDGPTELAIHGREHVAGRGLAQMLVLPARTRRPSQHHTIRVVQLRLQTHPLGTELACEQGPRRPLDRDSLLPPHLGCLIERDEVFTEAAFTDRGEQLLPDRQPVMGADQWRLQIEEEDQDVVLAILRDRADLAEELVQVFLALEALPQEERVLHGLHAQHRHHDLVVKADGLVALELGAGFYVTGRALRVEHGLTRESEQDLFTFGQDVRTWNVELGREVARHVADHTTLVQEVPRVFAQPRVLLEAGGEEVVARGREQLDPSERLLVDAEHVQVVALERDGDRESGGLQDLVPVPESEDVLTPPLGLDVAMPGIAR